MEISFSILEDAKSELENLKHTTEDLAEEVGSKVDELTIIKDDVWVIASILLLVLAPHWFSAAGQWLIGAVAFLISDLAVARNRDQELAVGVLAGWNAEDRHPSLGSRCGRIVGSEHQPELGTEPLLILLVPRFEPDGDPMSPPQLPRNAPVAYVLVPELEGPCVTGWIESQLSEPVYLSRVPRPVSRVEGTP